ncbi:TPA: hypothetical protein N0F65_000882 [Lagenidium giganteum]|uniref:Uncharacterized protein n=1 Tax=Lagenidium giganteum TaxID=4803 RepID=A0AAV2Z4R7_9STRA|nr:TPA: hypothetical protein N0F65_000882 [Lagenidium giganteum]
MTTVCLLGIASTSAFASSAPSY